MSGFITIPEVLANRQLIIDVWGIDFFWSCLYCEEGQTFLGLLIELKKI